MMRQGRLLEELRYSRAINLHHKIFKLCLTVSSLCMKELQHKHKPILTQTSIINIFFKRSIGNNLFYAILQRLEKCSEDLQKVFRGIARYPQA